MGKAICDEAAECLPGRCVETRQLALALGRLLCPEHVRVSFCFLFTEPWGFDFYEKFKAICQEDRQETILRFYREAADLELSAESRCVSLDEIKCFFTPESDAFGGDFSCRAAIVLLDWSIVGTWIRSKSETWLGRGSYFGHFCILVDIKGDEAFLIDPSMEESKERSGHMQGGYLRKIPLRVFESARRSPGTDEDLVFVSWHPPSEEGVSYLRKTQWQLPDALLSACYQGKENVVSALLRKRAGVDSGVGNLKKSSEKTLELRTFNSATDTGASRLRTTPLVLCSWRGHFQLVCLLLQSRVDPNAVEPGGSTALWFAAEAGHLEVWEEEGVSYIYINYNMYYVHMYHIYT